MKNSILETNPKVIVDVQKEQVNRFQNDLKKRIEENRAYNENILSEKEHFDKLTFFDPSYILVRTMKFEGEQDNNGVLLERKFKAFETEGGRPASKVDDWSYASKAIVVRTVKEDVLESLKNEELKMRYNYIKEGVCVWISYNALRNDAYTFIHNRNYPVMEYEGYHLIPLSAVQCIEN